MTLWEIPESIRDRIEPEPNSGCWLWTGHLIKDGYARTRFGKRGPQFLVHRYLYELEHGPIPAGLVSDHLCRTPSCVNPDHIELVTDLENCRRGLKVSLKTTCKHGHPWVPENMLIRKRKSGEIYHLCRECKRIRSAVDYGKDPGYWHRRRLP